MDAGQTDAKSRKTLAAGYFQLGELLKKLADQSVAAVAAIVKTGWALPSELKETDIDALRGRRDPSLP